MITVAVTAHLARPAVIESSLHLDALLMARHPSILELDETITRTEGTVMVVPLPLCVARAADAWVWCASAWVAERQDGAAALVKRRDGVDYLMTNRTVRPGIGPDRDRLRRFPIVRGPVTFAATVPDEPSIGEIERLVCGIQQLGGLRRAGYGAVSKWSVETVDAPWQSCLIDGAGLTRRILPASMVRTSSPAAPLPVTPPYWRTFETHLAHPPGTRGELCEITITSPDMPL